MQAAVIAGVFDNVLPPFSCPGSSCTYPEFTSIALCSTCNSVTADTTKNCTLTSERDGTTLVHGRALPIRHEPREAQGANERTPTLQQPPARRALPPSTPSFKETCVFRTPGNFNLTGKAQVAGVQLGHPAYSVVTRFEPAPDDTIPAMAMKLAVVQFQRRDAMQAFKPSDLPRWTEGMQAYECSFELCAKTYSNWTSTNGSLPSGTTTSHQLRFLDQKLTLATSDPATADRLPGVIRIIYTNVADPTLRGQENFTINLMDYSNIFLSLGRAFSLEGNETTVVQQTMGRAKNFPQAVKRLETAVSYRMLGGPNATTVYGNVSKVQTYISVQWPWASLLIIVSLLACVVLLNVLFLTRKSTQLTSKSSLLPLLLVGGDRKQQEAYELMGRRIPMSREEEQLRRGNILDYLQERQGSG
jgi:hypothetical protein